MKSKKIMQIAGIILLALAGCILCLLLFGTVAKAAGLVDDTINVNNLYSKYSLKNFQLDFYVKNEWTWLPWHWKDGIGNTVMYGLYMLTNMLWTLSLYISYATGYVVQEAYKLDFVKDLSSAIGANIQTIAGVTPTGFSADGFYLRVLPIIILVVGIYATYTGLMKHEVSKAIQAIINFVVVFVVSSALIAYAPQYINTINEFSSDLSVTALEVGTKIVMPNSNTKGKDSVDLIRDSLFAIQVYQPWLILQYGTSDISAIGEERIENLLSTSPALEDGKKREEVVIEEIEIYKNSNLSVTEVGGRLGTVFFLLFLNIGISFFVFVLTGIMLLSQILFIIFAMFLPINFLLSMLPGQEAKWKQAITKLFNTIMTRVGITFIVTVAFSISGMLYSLSSGYPFFMIAFLQIVTFAGIYIKINDLLGIFSVQSNDSQNVGRQIVRRPYMLLRRNARKAGRNIKRALKNGEKTRSSRTTENRNSMERSTNGGQGAEVRANSLGQKAGNKIGAALDYKNRTVDKVKDTGERIKNTPTNVRYAVHNAGENVKQNVSDLKSGISGEQKSRQQKRDAERNQYRQEITQKRTSLEQAAQQKQEKRAKRNNETGNQNNQSDEGHGYYDNEKEYARNQTKNIPKRENVRIKKPVTTNKKRVEGSDKDISDFYATHGMHQSDAVKAPKKKKLFEKPDYNEDVTEYRKSLSARMQGQGQLDASRKNIKVADRTPTVHKVGEIYIKKDVKQSIQQTLRKNERQKR